MTSYKKLGIIISDEIIKDFQNRGVVQPKDIDEMQNTLLYIIGEKDGSYVLKYPIGRKINTISMEHVELLPDLKDFHRVPISRIHRNMDYSKYYLEKDYPIRSQVKFHRKKGNSYGIITVFTFSVNWDTDTVHLRRLNMAWFEDKIIYKIRNFFRKIIKK